MARRQLYAIAVVVAVVVAVVAAARFAAHHSPTVVSFNEVAPQFWCFQIESCSLGITRTRIIAGWRLLLRPRAVRYNAQNCLPEPNGERPFPEVQPVGCEVLTALTPP
jgi:hypothetical protein